MSITKQPGCNDSFEQGAVTVDQALEKILHNTKQVSDFDKLLIRDCLNRTLFEDIESPLNVPAYDNSAMDGYAVDSSDLPEQGVKIFKIIGTAFAGRPFAAEIGKNECVRIMTGAIMPESTDCIVIQEHVQAIAAEEIEIGTGNRQNQNVRFAGEDIKQGSLTLTKGHVIKSADVGVLASLGIGECKVYRKPRVSFFSTGDELKSIGDELAKGEIYDSNRYSLHGLLTEAHVDLIDMGVVKDDPGLIRKTLLLAASCSDVIITSGGVSVGDADYIKGILNEIGDMDFWKILMKPGRPLTFGKINETLFFGLPGNPVAVMVTFYQFVLPCLKKLSGKMTNPMLSFRATSRSAIRKNPGRREYQRAIVSTDDNGDLQVILTGKQGSGILTSMTRANCFIVLPEQCGNVSEGDTVNVEFFENYFQH
jgi:molybdopterin molybdotransferase